MLPTLMCGLWMQELGIGENLQTENLSKFMYPGKKGGVHVPRVVPRGGAAQQDSVHMTL